MFFIFRLSAVTPFGYHLCFVMMKISIVFSVANKYLFIYDDFVCKTIFNGFSCTHLKQIIEKIKEKNKKNIYMNKMWLTKCIIKI